MRESVADLRSLPALTSYPASVYFEGTNLTEGRRISVAERRQSRLEGAVEIRKIYVDRE